MTELVVECSASAYMTDTILSRFKRIPAGTTKHLFQPMFIGLANLAVAAITAVWWIPGIPLWWAHASLPNTEQLTDPSNMYWVAWLGVAFIGCMFRNLSRHNFQTMRNAKQLAHEERLKQGRLGPRKQCPHNIL